MTTIKEVAKQSGFSQATISRLFKGDETLSITEETKNIIINTALAMGFDRSKIKTTLEKIVFLFWITKQEEVQDVYFSKLRTTIEKYAKLNNMSVQILTHEAGINAIPKNISGFIGLGSFSTKEIKQLKKRCPNGVLLAQITPRGGRIAGTSSIVQLDAWNWEDASIKTDDGIHLNWPRSYSRAGWWAEPGGIEINKCYEPQTQSFQVYFATASAYLGSKNTKKDIPYEAMKGLQSGEKTLFINANGEKEIIDAVLFKKKNNIKNMTIIGGYYAFRVAPLLKENNVSLLLKRIHDLPLLEDEDVNLPYKNAKLLVDAGILVGLENAGDMERMQTRNLPFYAGTCAAWGLSKEQALQLISGNTAKILGIDQQYGTLEAGKSATLFISEGDALDMKSNLISLAFIDGRNISLESHHTELYKLYKEKFEQAQK